MKKGVIFAAAISEVGGVLNSPKFGYRRVSENPFEVWENPTKVAVITGIGLANAATARATARSSCTTSGPATGRAIVCRSARERIRDA